VSCFSTLSFLVKAGKGRAYPGEMSEVSGRLY